MFSTSVTRSVIAVAIVAWGVLEPQHLQSASLMPQPSLRLQFQARGAASAPSSPQRAILDKYCVTCHNQRQRTADLMLDTMDVQHVAAQADVWEKVVRKLRTGSMPPAGMPRPDGAAYDSLASSLETQLDRAAAAAPNPGRPAIHRLNRVEYTNAIRDLLGIAVDGQSLLPTDESGYGFDNIADVLSLSPGLLERYMTAARKISRLAVGDPTMRPVVQMFRMPKLLVQTERMSDDLPFRSRGGTLIRHYFPLDGEYILRIRLRRTFTSNLPHGLTNRELLDVRLDGERMQLFTVGGECVGSADPRCKRPDNRTASPSEYERTADDGLVVRFSAKAGMRVIGIAFAKRTTAVQEGAAPERNPAGFSSASDNENQPMSVETVQLEGPTGAAQSGDTASRRRIFVCQPSAAAEEEACAARILSTLVRRAYRRPATDRDVQPLLGLYRVGRKNGGFETGIQLALEGLLVSPNFLVRIERDPANVSPGAAYRLDDLALASRLSFFLWSSIPDDELLDVAARGQLRNPEALAQQVRRMLADPRAQSLVTNFAGQWLYLRNMRSVAPDPREFPEFDDNLRDAFQRETELFLGSLLREDRSVLDILRADYTFVNERLARFYGIPHVYGTHFRRVALNDPNRVGLLGHGSVLTVTSYATRTSPVLRGIWLLENLLGAPPAPPPPDVPALEENGDGGKPPTSVRERLQEHRKNPVCAGCHARMDPLGFALENFDAIGRWRTQDANTPVDATGALPDGTKFAGPAEFRTALLAHQTEVVSTVAEKLLTYALGRGVEHYDMPAVRRIVREAASSDYRWSAVILEIVKSTPFQMRTARAGETARSNGSTRPN